MKIWGFKAPSHQDYSMEKYKKNEFLTKSIVNGASHLGWGYMDNFDCTYFMLSHFLK